MPLLDTSAYTYIWCDMYTYMYMYICIYTSAQHQRTDVGSHLSGSLTREHLCRGRNRPNGVDCKVHSEHKTCISGPEMGKLKWVTKNIGFSCQDPPKFTKRVSFPPAFRATRFRLPISGPTECNAKLASETWRLSLLSLSSLSS